MSLRPVQKVPSAERVQSSYKLLKQSAKNLNSASDDLGKAISVLDEAVKRLNLGVSAWVQLSSNEVGQDWWSRDLGYARVGGKWCIALRKRIGNYNYPEGDSTEEWVFNEATRWMRIEAVGKIPDLLEELLKKSQETTKRIKDKTSQALEIAAAMNRAAEESATESEAVSSLVDSMNELAESGRTPEAT